MSKRLLPSFKPNFELPLKYQEKFSLEKHFVCGLFLKRARPKISAIALDD